MKLLIVESPAKAKTIAKYLDNEYTVKSSVGHIRDLPKSNKNAIDVARGFAPHYEIVPGKEKVARELKSFCKKADEVVLATDPDREGEAIAWHIAEVCDLGNSASKTPHSKLKRIVFHEITKPAVVEAMQHPRAIDMDLKTAQEARRVLDRLFGYDLSGLIWKKIRYGLSAGRVQSPALRILMERERDIRAFVPHTYWIITAETKTVRGELLTLTASVEPRDKKETERIVAAGSKAAWSVAAVEETEQKRAARPPFTTSTLQQAASTRLGFTPSRTMRAAQALYEAGRITYMRTDSTVMSEIARQEIVSFVRERHGEAYVSPRQFKTRSKVAQEAHEAIRPTAVTEEAAGATPDQKKIYELIRRRAIASQMADARVARTKIVARVETSGEPIPDFYATGARVAFDGWLAADPAARGEDTEVPAVREGDRLELLKIWPLEKQTEPPKRYTEAGLIKELEKRGIGRPSTYAAIMQTLADRNYVERVERTLHPTDLGDVVNDFLEKNFGHYVSDSFTAEMENKLDEIAEGKRGYAETLSDFYTPFTKDVAAKQDTGKITDLGKAPDDMRCPECGAAMVLKLGRAGKFYSCSRFPECRGARTIEGDTLKKEEPQETGEKCPECGAPLVRRHGKYGEFTGCSAYPKCKYIKKDAGPSSSADPKQPAHGGTGVKCPECGKGEIVERRGRFGSFYSCSEYPKCKFSIKAKPTGRTCPQCGSLMMEGTKTIPERCSNKSCPNHNPNKKKDGPF